MWRLIRDWSYLLPFRLRPREVQIATHTFNSRIVYQKQRRSTHVKFTSQWLDLCQQTLQSAQLDAVTSETQVDNERVNFCVQQHIILEGDSSQKNHPNPLETLSPTRYGCRNFVVDATKKKTRFARFNFQIDSAPNILRSCLVHCQRLEFGKPGGPRQTL